MMSTPSTDNYTQMYTNFMQIHLSLKKYFNWFEQSPNLPVSNQKYHMGEIGWISNIEIELKPIWFPASNNFDGYWPTQCKTLSH